MLRPRSDNPLGQIQTLFQVGTFGGLTDGELLDRFATGEGEVAKLAIAVLVERHGPMVRRVCRSILHNPHDADDAFQATFFVLARQAGSIRNRDSIASWLHGVARRVAICALDAEARRRRHERGGSKAELSVVANSSDQEEVSRIVHDELGRLPEKYRAPIVLCHLEGLTHEQAAHRLHWPVGTVRSRLSRGRDRLRDRLIRRGAAPAVAASACAFAGETASAGVSLSLVRSIVQHASTGTISPSVSSLVKGVLNAMAMTKLKIAGAVLAVVMTTSGLGLFALDGLSSRLLAQAKSGSGAVSHKSPANPAHPHIVIAQHVILWDNHVVTWDQIVKRLRAKRPAGPFHATFHTTNGLSQSKKAWSSYHDRIMKLYSELFEPVGVSFHSVSPRGSAIYDAIRTAEDVLPDSRFARTGQVLTPDGKPAHDAQVIVLPVKGPLAGLGVALSGTQLHTPFDEQWSLTDERGEFITYPKDKPYLLMVLHPSGFATQSGSSKEKAIRLTPWATVTIGSTGNVADQQVVVSVRPDGINPGEPGLQISPIQTKGQPVEIKVPAGEIAVSRSLAMGEGVHISLPVESFSLNPGESCTLEVKPPSDAERKRAKALHEELHGPKAKR